MIAITGGAGFIGSALVWGLNRRGITDILAVDTLENPGERKNLRGLRFADYLNNEVFIARLEQGLFDANVEGIIHMGACADTTENNKDFLLRNNYEYTKRLALWCVEKNKRFVFASTAATYGDGKEGFSDDHSLLPAMKPLNMYGHSKNLFDLWALKQGYLKKIAGLKYFNVFGPNEYHKADMRSVVHKVFEQIKAEGKARLFKSYLPEYKDGWQLRDFIYVKDAVEMTLFIYENAALAGIFNIGTGKARSFYDLAVSVFRLMRIEPDIEYIDMPGSLRDRYQYFSEARISKLQEAGYNKKIYSLEEGVGDYIGNYLLKEDPYLKV